MASSTEGIAISSCTITSMLENRDRLFTLGKQVFLLQVRKHWGDVGLRVCFFKNGSLLALTYGGSLGDEASPWISSCKQKTTRGLECFV